MIEQYFFNILRMSIISFVLICLILFISKFTTKKYSNKWRYHGWLLIIILMIIPINFEFEEIQDKKVTYINIYQLVDSNIEGSSLVNGVPPISNEVSNASNEVLKPEIDTINSLDSILITSNSIKPVDYKVYFIMIWFSGCIIAMIIQVSSYLNYLFKLKRWSYEIKSDNIIQEFVKVRSKLTVKKEVKLKICEDINSPMLFGAINPTVYLPNMSYEPDELNFIFTHELMHFKRKDIWVKLLTMVVRIIYWFNPFSFLLSKLISKDIELCCDEDVVKKYDENEKKAYVRTILNMMKLAPKNRCELSMNFFGGKHYMKKRIENLISNSVVKKGRVIFIMILMISFLLLNLVACKKEQNNITPLESSTNVTNGIELDDNSVDEEDVDIDMSMDDMIKIMEDLEAHVAGISVEESNKQIEVLLQRLKERSSDLVGVDLSNINYIDSESVRNESLEIAVWERYFKGIYTQKNMPEYRYYYNYIDLNNDGKDEVFVMLVGTYFSVAGGSSGVVFEVNNEKYTVINEINLIQSSIIISDNLTNGWHDIVMYGGNIEDGYRFYVLKHTGESYPIVSNKVPALNYNEVLTGSSIFNGDITLDSGIFSKDE